MITDRTAADVAEALRVRAEVIQAGGTPTEEEQNALDRGFVSVDTLNRIEQSEAGLVLAMNALGYYNVARVDTRTGSSEWTEDGIFRHNDLTRLIFNTILMRRAFYEFPTTPARPNARLHYDTFNALEKIIEDMQTIAAYIPTQYHECGDYECGGD